MMRDLTNRPLWLRCIVGVLAAVLAAAFRWQFLGVLELRAVFLTFYPAVAVAALYGGFSAGLLATVISAALAGYFWMEPVGQFGITNVADLLGIIIFLSIGTFISFLTESAFRAQARAYKAEEQSRLASERERAEEERKKLTQVRLELIEYAALHPLDELLSKALDEIGAFVGSPIGFYHFVESDQKTLSLQQWSTRTLNEFCRAEGKGRHYSIDEAGVWVDCVRERKPVIHNDYNSLKRKKGMPEGHAKVIRELVIPVMREGKVVAILGVGNKLADYTEKDAENVVYLADVTWEIIERKRADDAVRDSKAKLETALASMTDAVFISDAEGRFIECNDAFVAYHRFRNRDDCSKMLTECTEVLEAFMADGQPAPPDQWAVSRALRGERVSSTEYILRRKDTGEKWVGSYSFSPIRDKDGTIAGAVVTARDITEKKRMEEEIRKSRDELELRVKERTAELESANEVVKSERKRLFDVLETLPAMICLLTSDYHVAFANRSFRERFGESHGRHCYEYCFGRPEPCDFCESYKVLKTGQPHHWEVTGPDGSVIDAYDFPFTDMDGSPMILEMDIDITDWRRAEAELKSTMAKLEQSNQALQDFASIASHDLQEPLRKVSIFADMLKRKCGALLGEEGNSYLVRVLDANERMQSLLKGLLEYSRVTTQGNPFSEVDLKKTVDDVLSDLEVMVERAGAEVRVSELPTVKADPTQMRQVFQNLIGNALKFRKEGEKPVIDVRSAVVDGKLQIMVEDNGIGFKEQYIEKIFAPFQRLHGKSSQYEGTGMGLAICKKIVERHGGSITAKSSPGAGAEFIIMLPDASRGKVPDK